MDSIGRNIKKVIKKKGFTLEQVASMMQPGIRHDDDVLRHKIEVLSKRREDLKEEFKRLQEEDYQEDKLFVENKIAKLKNDIECLDADISRMEERMQDITQLESTRYYRISQSALSQMLKGNPSITRVIEIARIVGVSVSELIGDAPITRGAIVGATITCPHCKKDIYLHVEDEDYKDIDKDPHNKALGKV